MSDTPVYSHLLRLADLPVRKPTRFSLAPGSDARSALAEAFGITAVSALTFKGELRAGGNKDWQLTAELDAEVEQPCVVTLAPVVTDIHEPVLRRYVADLPPPEAEETEMPEDDSIEPLPETIDLGAVMAEALALALPLYPRSRGARLDQPVFCQPGVAPLTDEALRPFADLADILRKGTPKQ